MKYQTKITGAILIVTAAFAAACASEEGKQTAPVTTTTGGSTTVASPAAEVRKRDFAFLRVVHAVPGGGAVDVATDQGTAFTGAAYKQVTPYKEVESEAQNIKVLPAGQASAQALASNREILVAGHHYTAIATPDSDGDGITLRVVDDNITPTDTGKAKVRVIHASADAGEVDVYAKGNNTALFDGINYQSASSYSTVDPMTATLEVRPEGQAKSVLTIPNAKFEAGKLYTVIVTGKAKGTPKLEATVIQDQIAGNANMMTPGSTPMASPAMTPRM
jgi:Domain of unknown function (DUF4397)